MGYTLLERLRWGTENPAIYANFYYDLYRNGSSMLYRVKIDIEPVTGGSYFGYPIYEAISLDGAQKDAATIKNASPSQWSSDYLYETDWMEVPGKTSGATALSIHLYSGLGSSRSGTYNYDLPISPAASVLGSISAFAVGSSIPISITKYNSGFVDNLTIRYGGATIKTISNIANGASVSFTTDELNTIYGLMSTVNSGAFTFTLETFSGSTSLGTSTQTPTGYITDAAPTLSASVVDVNSATIALTGDSTKLVKCESTARVTITASGNKGASIASKVINGISVSGETLDIVNVSTTPLVVTVTDSRGNSSTVTLNPAVISYVPLTISANFYRPEPTTGEVAVKFSGNYFNGSFGATSNTLALSWKYRLKGASDWTTGGTFTAGADYTISGNAFGSGAVSLGIIFDYQKNYEFILYFSDKLISSDTGAIFVSKGIPVFDFGEDDFAFHVPVSFNGKSLLDLLYPIGSIYMNTTTANPGDLFGGTWVIWGAGRVPVCVDVNDPDFWSLEKTGGEKTHILTLGEIPYHSHDLTTKAGSGAGSNYGLLDRTGDSANELGTVGQGGGQAHNNLQPYITCFMWKRTA